MSKASVTGFIQGLLRGRRARYALEEARLNREMQKQQIEYEQQMKTKLYERDEDRYQDQKIWNDKFNTLKLELGQIQNQAAELNIDIAEKTKQDQIEMSSEGVKLRKAQVRLTTAQADAMINELGTKIRTVGGKGIQEWWEKNNLSSILKTLSEDPTDAKSMSLFYSILDQLSKTLPEGSYSVIENPEEILDILETDEEKLGDMKFLMQKKDRNGDPEGYKPYTAKELKTYMEDHEKALKKSKKRGGYGMKYNDMLTVLDNIIEYAGDFGNNFEFSEETLMDADTMLRQGLEELGIDFENISINTQGDTE